MSTKKVVYKTGNTIKYLVTRTWELDKNIFLLFMGYTISNSATPLISIIIPTLVVGELSDGANLNRIFAILSILLCGGIILNIVAELCRRVYWPKIIEVRMDFILQLNKKIMSLNYQLVENPEIQDEISKAKMAIGTNTTGIEGILNQLFSVASNIVTIMVFSAVLSRLNIFLFLFLFATVLGGYLVSAHFNKKNHELQTKMAPEDRELVYLDQRIQLPGPAKDIRLYNMFDWLKDCYFGVFERKYSYIKDIFHNDFKTSILLATLFLLRDGVVYGYLIAQVFKQNLSLSELTLYFITIINFSDRLNGIAFAFSDIKKQNLFVNDYRTFMQRATLQNNANNKLTSEIVCPTIEFQNVSFRYPRTENDIIKNVSYTIKGGSKIALVGGNGAGKTTLVKILCRLYEPTEGRILIDGIDYKEFDLEDYYHLLSVVFQDMELYAFSLAENISLKDKASTDVQKIEECIEKVDLIERYKKLPRKTDTNILRKFDSEGIELSGGETQKLFLARAMYKSAPIVILDEPTAALDALAEKNLYEHFNELTKDKTALYISHRLASTRFCDEIIFLENGKILEKGTHDDLIKKDGAYARFYRLQSKYYLSELERVEFGA